MSNHMDASRMSPEQQYGVIEQRFRNIEGQVGDLKSSLSTQIAAISTKMDERSKPQWQLIISALGVMTSILLALGGLAYMPIRGEQVKAEQEIMKLREQIVPRTEHESRWNDSARLTEKLAQAISRLNETTITRNELETRLNAAAQRRDDFQRITDSRLERLQKLVDDGQGETITRTESERVLRTLDLRFNDLSKRLDTIEATRGRPAK